MARKTKEEAEKTRQQILDAALDVFYEKGYSRSTLVDIAQQIGLTKGAIYWHFKSKVALFLGLGQEMEERMKLELGDFDDQPLGLSGVKELSLRVMTLITNDPQLNKYYGLIYYRIEWEEELLPVMDFFYKQDEAFKAYIIVAVQKSQEDGEIDPNMEVTSLATTWLALFDGFLSRILMQKENVPATLKDYEFGLDLFLKGVR